MAIWPDADRKFPTLIAGLYGPTTSTGLMIDLSIADPITDYAPDVFLTRTTAGEKKEVNEKDRGKPKHCLNPVLSLR